MEQDDAKDRNIDFKVTQFSDSIVLSYGGDSEDQLAFIIMSISDMISRLIQYGFLLRGSITQGKVIHTDKQLFGPAMNEAYKLESEYACYPRVIIPKKVFQKAKFSTDVGEMAKERIVSYCTIDDDGWHYINYIGSERYISAKNHMEHIQNLCKIIDENIETYEESIRKKYVWINTKLSSELKWTENNYKNMPEEELSLFAILTAQVAKFDIALNY
jgi:hypothetical protein